MTIPGDAPELRYLWDPAAPADAAVAEIERLVAPLRFAPAAAALTLPRRRIDDAGRRWLRRFALAAVASLLLLAAIGAYHWSWPAGKPWPMTVSRSGGEQRATLPIGGRLRLGPAEVARLRVARIGTIEVGADSDLTLRETASNRHRLALVRGTLDVRVWAPPRAVVVLTPAGQVADLGCTFRLRVDADGIARVSVGSGWVQLDNARGEALVPAGASSEMTPGSPPGAPVFDDAEPAFRAGVRQLERQLATASPTPAPLGFLSAARRRDVLTLLVVADAAPPRLQPPLLERAAALVPPPAGVRRDEIARGARDPLWRWVDALDLPPPKSWWRNWRDAIVWLR
jgi:ferric-dicitrate binding protein FerR (iron transport regulator)